jgi:RNA-binding protein
LKRSEEDKTLPPAVSKPLKGYQRKYLRAMAHGLKPVLLIGQRGVSPAVALEMEEALNRHELIKVKFIESKDKSAKQKMAEALRDAVRAHLVGMIGHTAIFFRPNPDPEKQKIHPPQRPSNDTDEGPTAS